MMVRYDSMKVFPSAIWLRMALLLAVMGWVLAPAAVAGQQLTLTAPFLSVVVDRGEEVKLPFTVENLSETPQTVNVSIPLAPEGWMVVVEREFPRLEVRRVYLTAPDAQAELDEQTNRTELQFRAKPSSSVKPGDYTFAIKATTESGTAASLQLTVFVGGEEASGGVSIESQFPVLRAASGTAFEFKVDVQNNVGEDRTFELSSVAPAGWQIGFEPEFERKQVTTISMKSGRTQGLKVSATPPPRVEAGTFPITVVVRSGDAEAEMELQAVVTGTYDILLGTATGRLNTKVTAGQASPFTMIVANGGSAQLADISFFAGKPDGWEVTFSPERIDILDSQEPREVNLEISAPDKTIPGDYSLSVAASSLLASDDVEVRVTVLATTVWGWVGLGIVVVVLAALGGVLVRLGRR